MIDKIYRYVSPRYKFLESSTLNQALQNLQSQVSNLVNTYKDILFDKYLLMPTWLNESDKRNLLLKVNELQNDFNNVLRAMVSVHKQLNHDNPVAGDRFKYFVDKQSAEVLNLYNDCIVEPMDNNLARLLQDMYFMFDMCFRTINTILQQYNNKNKNKIPLVNTLRQPEYYETSIDFLAVLKDSYDKGKKLFVDMENCCY